MKNTSESPLISIVIPHKDDMMFLKNLVNELAHQTLKNFEIIIVDSSHDDMKISKDIFCDLNTRIKVIHTNNAFPGKARNIGAHEASAKFIAFIDSKSIPVNSWLQENYDFLNSSDSRIILGLFRASSDNLNFFQKILKASSYGNLKHVSVPGSMMRKDIFISSGGFNEDVGAGEDIEWVERLQRLNIKTSISENINFFYIVFPETFYKDIKKWAFYSFENAKINILQTQKSLYFILLTVLILYFIYSWNYLFTQGAWSNSPYFVPNLNTIVWSVLFAFYSLVRGIIMPFNKKEQLSYIFPFKWILIAILGFLIDVSKLPGRIYGLYRLFFSININKN
jgi:glycosyltransferase involved in cell wall biosynthesis